MKFGILFAMTLSMFIFVGSLAYAEETKTFFIHPQLVDCVGVGPMKCMQIRENLHSEWLNFQQGVSYQINVKITDVENPPADASSKKYELVEIIKQESTTEYFPYKNICVPGFASLGEICVLNDRCGPGIYPGKVCVMDGVKQPYLRPTQQGNAGIPACIKPQSVGWMV